MNYFEYQLNTLYPYYEEIGFDYSTNQHILKNCTGELKVSKDDVNLVKITKEEFLLLKEVENINTPKQLIEILKKLNIKIKLSKIIDIFYKEVDTNIIWKRINENQILINFQDNQTKEVKTYVVEDNIFLREYILHMEEFYEIKCYEVKGGTKDFYLVNENKKIKRDSIDGELDKEEYELLSYGKLNATELAEYIQEKKLKVSISFLKESYYNDEVDLDIIKINDNKSVLIMEDDRGQITNSIIDNKNLYENEYKIVIETRFLSAKDTIEFFKTLGKYKYEIEYNEISDNHFKLIVKITTNNYDIKKNIIMDFSKNSLFLTVYRNEKEDLIIDNE